MRSREAESKAKRVRGDSALLDALHALQAQHGYVPRSEAMALSTKGLCEETEVTVSM